MELLWVSTQTGQDTATVRGQNFTENLVPNVVGMDAEDAIFILENVGVKVQIEGRGVVKKQSILPGSLIPEHGARIKLISILL